MSLLIQKEVNGVTFQVRRLTIRQLYDLFGAAAQKQKEKPKPEENQDPPDLLGQYLFEHATIDDILEFTDLNREQVLNMLPEDAEQVINAIKEANPHFFAACQRMAKVGTNLDTLMATLES